jgi:predicted transcriptional regulator
MLMTSNGSHKRIVHVQVDRETTERLERLAATQERTLSAEIRVALREHLAGQSERRTHDLERKVA